MENHVNINQKKRLVVNMLRCRCGGDASLRRADRRGASTVQGEGRKGRDDLSGVVFFLSRRVPSPTSPPPHTNFPPLLSPLSLSLSRHCAACARARAGGLGVQEREEGAGVTEALFTGPCCCLLCALMWIRVKYHCGCFPPLWSRALLLLSSLSSHLSVRCDTRSRIELQAGAHVPHNTVTRHPLSCLTIASFSFLAPLSDT